MRHTRTAVLLLALVIPFTTFAQNSRSTRHRPRTIEGTVIGRREGPRWLAIVIESGGRRYMVTTDHDPNALGRDPTRIGDVESIGSRVRVTYIGSEPWEANMPALNATRIVRLGNQSVAPRGRQLSSTAQNWDTFWNTFRTAVRKRDRVALKGMMTVEFNTLAGISYTAPDARDAVLQDINWNNLDKVLRQGVGPLQKARGKTIRQAPPILKGVGMVAIFEISSDGRWRWSDFYFYH